MQQNIVLHTKNSISKMAKMQKSICSMLLLVSLCAGQPTPDFRANCDVGSDSDMPNVPRTYYSIDCDHINKPEDVQFLKQALDSIQNASIPIAISLSASYLDALKPELFQSHNVTNLMFLSCMTTKMPYDLICSKTVLLAALVGTRIPSGKLTPQGFKDCNKLQALALQNTSLSDIPPGSFQGLESLTELRIVNNDILHVPEFSGIENTVERLVVAFNPISFIPKNAFQNIKNLTDLNLMNSSITAVVKGAFDAMGPGAHVVLSGNPLRCDCSQKWLQQWFKQHPPTETETYGIPYCATPVVAPLMTLDFCNKTTSSITSAGPSFQPGMMQTIVLIFLMILLTC